MYLFGGAFVTASRYRQEKILLSRGSTPLYNHNTLATILYGASIASTTVNCISFIFDSRIMVGTSSAVNSVVLLSSWIVNTITAGRQQSQIESGSDHKQQSKASFRALPYFSANKAYGEAGILVTF